MATSPIPVVPVTAEAQPVAAAPVVAPVAVQVATPDPVAAAPQPTQTQHESFIQKLGAVFHHDVAVAEKIGGEVLSVLQLAVKEADKGMTVAVKYLPEAGALATVLFPQAKAVQGGIAAATSVVDLLQKGVVAMQAGYAKIQGETGAAKSADLTTLTESTILPIIQSFDPKFNASQVQAKIDAIVAILKATTVTT